MNSVKRAEQTHKAIFECTVTASHAANNGISTFNRRKANAFDFYANCRAKWFSLFRLLIWERGKVAKMNEQWNSEQKVVVKARRRVAGDWNNAFHYMVISLLTKCVTFAVLLSPFSCLSKLANDNTFNLNHIVVIMTTLHKQQSSVS